MVFSYLPLFLFLFSSATCTDTGWSAGLAIHAGAPGRCADQQQHFAQLFSDYSNCVLRASRPLTLCLDCMHFRLPLDQALETIQNDSDCAGWLLDEDGVIFQMKSFYSSLLARANCRQCETWVRGRFEPAEEVRQYVDAQNRFMKCVNDVGSGNTSMCSVCREHYLLSCTSLQRCVRDPDSWQTCRDVIDKANVSMRVWEISGCLPDRLPTSVRTAALATAACGFLVMLAFYAGLALWKRRPSLIPYDVITGGTNVASDESLLREDASNH